MKQIVLNIRNGKKNADVAFPCTEEELGKALASIGLANTPSQKAYVTEVVEPDAFCLLESKVLDLDEVNYLAKLMDSEDATERKTLFAVTACEGYDTPKELINLHFNLGCYTLIQPTDDTETVGRRYLYSIKGCMTSDEAKNTDFESIGRELLTSHKGIQTDYGTVFRNEEAEAQEIYDGQVFPCYHYTGEELLCVEAEYKGKREYLYLPDEPMSITKALHRLGADKPEDCSYRVEDFNADSREWRERFEGMLQSENIFDINSAAEKINVANMDFDKLEGIVKYAGDDSAKTIAKLAEYIDDFEYIGGATDYTEVGQYAADITFRAGIPSELKEYIDFYGIGRLMEEEYAGKFVEDGFVYINSHTTLEELLGIPHENKMSEQQKM